ncbi:MAG: hypothetical protein ACAH95_06695 [Fimbriimonas sp.]
MEAIRLEATVRKDGSVLIPDLEEGERVELIVLRMQKPGRQIRQGGWAKGRVKILPGFDDPIPGMTDCK